MQLFEIRLTTVGGAGVAVASKSVNIPAGILRGIQVKYASQPVTTDVVITTTSNGVAKTLLTLTNKNTNLVMSSISEPLLDATATALADSTKNPNIALPAVAGTIDVTVAQGDAHADGVIVTVMIET